MCRQTTNERREACDRERLLDENGTNTPRKVKLDSATLPHVRLANLTESTHFLLEILLAQENEQAALDPDFPWLGISTKTVNRKLPYE